ncbi:hypothetical protein V6U81_04360 [Micromonospora sp. CPCC 205711]|uniref:hypothetical protein n=1 Tax=Micromonospora sp. CPCC 205547 TaxID=3122400 RepID=UPI002FF0EBAA
MTPMPLIQKFPPEWYARECHGLVGEMSDQEALASGNQKDSLEAIRRLLAEHLVVAEPKEVPALAKQLMAVLKEQEALGVGQEESPVDELRQQRDQRRAGTN